MKKQHFHFARLFKKGILFLLLFGFIYSPFLAVGDAVIKFPHVFMIALGLIGTPLLINQFLKNRLFRTTFSSKIAGFIILLILFLVHGANDASVFYLILPGFAATASAFIIVRWYSIVYGDSASQTILAHIFYVGAINGILIILQATSFEIESVFRSLFYYSDKAINNLIFRNNFSGILFEGFGVLSLTQAVTFICGIGSILNSKQHLPERHVDSFIFVMLSLIIFISTILTARLGVVIFILWYILFLFRTVAERSRLIAARKVRISLIYIIFPIFFAVALVFYLSTVEEYSSIIARGFEFYLNYSDNGTFNTSSTDVLLSRMYHLPEGFLSIVFGTGNYLTDQSLVESDVGYIIMIYGSGFIGLISVIIFYYMVYRVAHKFRDIHLNIAFVVWALCVIMMIANLKDFYLDKPQGLTQIFCLCYVLLVTREWSKAFNINLAHARG